VVAACDWQRCWLVRLLLQHQLRPRMRSNVAVMGLIPRASASLSFRGSSGLLGRLV
jgi:hypothetical protein